MSKLKNMNIILCTLITAFMSTFAGNLHYLQGENYYSCAPNRGVVKIRVFEGKYHEV